LDMYWPKPISSSMMGSPPQTIMMKYGIRNAPTRENYKHWLFKKVYLVYRISSSTFFFSKKKKGFLNTYMFFEFTTLANPYL
jgi:hypothetical protein